VCSLTWSVFRWYNAIELALRQMPASDGSLSPRSTRKGSGKRALLTRCAHLMRGVCTV
jgi:hypothetical protein